MFAEDAPAYAIDLTADEPRRWAEVIAREATAAGRIIGEAAARHLKPAVLELGGKAPFLVLDDADLDEAVKAAAFGSFVNQGQACISTERIVADASIADAFVAKLKRKAMTMTAGDPRRGDFALGSIVSREAAERIEKEIPEFIKYLNDEVVPAVRQHSTKALRVASVKLTELADYMEQQKTSQK